jgi:hypothetical protein
MALLLVRLERSRQAVGLRGAICLGKHDRIPSRGMHRGRSRRQR